LQDLATHKYIALLFDSLRAFRFFYIMFYYPIAKRLRGLILDQKVLANRMEYYGWLKSQTKKRIERETQRPDFMTFILKHNGEKGAEMNLDEIAANAAVIITAGSETTATLLSAVTYLLLKHPNVMQKLKDEVRGKWKKYDEITIDQVNNTPYLIAVLQEALRYFPPVPTGFQRRVPRGGESISGYYIPENTAVCVSAIAAAHSERNFKDPDAFVPERWMGDPLYANDNAAAVQPFSFGPRNCLGKNLAYAEMRLILAKMIWTFEMELEAKSKDWIKQCRVMTLWDKPELAVRIKEVLREE
jgi:cytochrome P450